MPRGMQDALRAAYENAPSVQGQQDSADESNEVDELGDEEQIEAADVEPRDGEDEGVELEYANDLPDILGIEPEDFYRLKWKLQDHKEPVALGDIKDTLQQIDSERMTLAQERAQLEEQQKTFQQQAMQYGQASQAVSQRMQQAAAQVQAIDGAMKALNEDWAARGKTDPGQVALERQQIAEQRQAAIGEYQAAQYEAQQEQAKAHEQWLADQNRTLIQQVPDWAIPEKRRGLQERIAKLAVERYGATQEELGRIDARTIRMLLDAEEGIRARENAKDAVTKVREKPKVQLRGVRMKDLQHSKQRAKDLTEKARQTRHKRDITAAVRGILEDAERGD